MSEDVGVPALENFKQLKERVAQEQAVKLQESGGIDLDNLPQQTHNWIERGAKLSCEGANHPYHSHFLVKRR